MDINEYKTLTNQRLSNSSQLKLFTILDDLSINDKYLNIFRNYILNESELNNSSFYELYEVSNDDWLDSIAYKKYGIAKLWWVVAITNNIVNPFEDLTPGDTLRILKNNYLYQILKDIKNIGDL